MKVALPQVPSKVGDKEQNLRVMKKFVMKIKAKLVVFPELFLTGYMCLDKYTTLAETIDGNAVRQVMELAKTTGSNIIFGMPEQDQNIRGIIYNSAVLLTPTGKVEVYRKLQLANFGPFEEKHYFREGNEIRVFETDVGKIGIMICFDLFFPELSKIYALQGADILVCISASPSTTRPFFEKVMLARAIENTTFFLYSNLIGTELNMVFWGGNAVVGPRGNIIAKGKYYKKELVSANIDLEDLKSVREFRPTIKDTRFEILNAIKKFELTVR